MDSEILTLQVDINDDPMNQKVDAIQERLSTLQKDAQQTAEGMLPTTESLPGYNDAFMRKLSEWQRSLTDIGRTRSAMEHTMNSYQREDLTAAYKRKVEVANASIKDLANSQNLVQELLGTLGPGMSQVFSKGLEGIVTQLTSGIRTTAASISSEVTRKLTDDEIVDRYMRNDDYKRIVGKLRQTNPDHAEAFSNQNMRKYLMANVPMSVPQYMRQAVTGGSQVQFRRDAENFMDLLPKSFQRITPDRQKTKPEDLRIRKEQVRGELSPGKETLTQEEIDSLGRLVRNNRYAADAAVKAGIIAKSGRKMYFNRATDHDMIDAMGGFLMDDLNVAAGGERKYGIRDVLNPKNWENIQGKIGNNKTVDGTLEAIRAMDDVYGAWLNPGRYKTEKQLRKEYIKPGMNKDEIAAAEERARQESLQPFDASSPNASYIGRITHSPRKTSRAFAEYSLEMMQQGVQLNGMHPFLKDKRTGAWTELPHVNGPRAATRTSPAVTPDDFHTISMNDSLLYKMVEATPSASKVGQNGFSDNMFYVKFEDDLGDPALTDEKRNMIADQYAKIFANGYKVNGEDYISTRISKTHAEFMKASIVDDIGRKALGMKYARKGEKPLDADTAARVRRAGLEVLANGGVPKGSDGTYATFKDFAKTLYNENNMATEGESLATWLGTKFGFTGNAETEKRLAARGLTEEQREHIMADYGTPNMKVVVGSFGKADMDGSNWISDRISDRGFQGRTFGGKATFVPINMRDFRFKNYKQIEENDETRARIAQLNEEKEARLSPLREERESRLAKAAEERDSRLAKINEERDSRLAKINEGESNQEWHDKKQAEIENWYNAEKTKIEDRYASITDKVKGTYDPKISRIENQYQKKEASIMNRYGGDLVIPGAGVRGNDLRISKDTDIVEDVNNIKHFKTALLPQFEAEINKIKESGASDAEKQAQIQAATEAFQQRMNETRSRDISRDEIYAKTSYDDANTSSRWLSKQLINSSMNAGFRDPRVLRYFDRQFFDEIARMDDDQYVRDLLFQGDQKVDLQSAQAQKTINDHLAGMWARYNEGDRLLPVGAFKYAMAAPNPQNVINNRLKEAGIALTPEQEALQLQDRQVISMESLNKQLGIVRFPATKSGNVTADNVSAEQLIKAGGASREQIQKLARSSGIVDTKGLYFAPNSPILKLLQGEDFDGDINGYFGLSDNMNPKDAKEFSEVMRIIATASDEEIAQINKDAYGTTDQAEAERIQDKRKAKSTNRATKDKNGGYNIFDAFDKARYLVNVPREHAMMGMAERSADMAALYSQLMDPTLRKDIAQAIKDYESQYDVVSTNMKTDEIWKQTPEQIRAANLGLSFSRMFKYANEAIQTTGENGNSVRVWNGESKEILEDKNIDKLGLPSLFQGEIMGTLMGRMKARQRGIDPEHGVFDWKTVLLDPKKGIAMPEGVDPNSEQGKFVRMMRGVRADFLDSKYLIASNQTVDALQEQREKAEAEIDKMTSNTAEGQRFKQKRLEAIGIRAFDAFKEYGSTERNANTIPQVQKALEAHSKETGIPVDQLVGHASFVQIPRQEPVQPEPQKTQKEPPKEAAKEASKKTEENKPVKTAQQPVITEQPQVQTPVVPEATQTTTTKAPVSEAVAPVTSSVEPKTAEKPSKTTSELAAKMASQESPEAQARRLLKEAGVQPNVIKNALAGSARDTLVSAIKNNNMDELLSIKGVSTKSAPKIMEALQGAKLLDVQATPAEEYHGPVASVTVPKKESTNAKSSETAKSQPIASEPPTVKPEAKQADVAQPVAPVAEPAVKEESSKVIPTPAVVPTVTSKSTEQPVTSVPAQESKKETVNPFAATTVTDKKEPEQGEAVTREALAGQYRKIQQYFTPLDKTGDVESVLQGQKVLFDRATEEKDLQNYLQSIDEIEKYLNMEAAFDRQAKQRGENLTTRPINEILKDLNSAQDADQRSKYQEELIRARTERAQIKPDLDGLRPVDDVVRDLNELSSGIISKPLNEELEHVREAEREAERKAASEKASQTQNPKPPISQPQNQPQNQVQNQQQNQTQNQQQTKQPVNPVQPPAPPSGSLNNPPAGGPSNNPPNGGSAYGNTVPQWVQPSGPSGSSGPGGPSGPSGPTPPGGGNPERAYAYYSDLWGKAHDFSSKLFGEIINYEQQNKDIPKSIRDFNRNAAIAQSYEREIRDFQGTSDYQYLSDDQKANLDRLISSDHGLVAKAGKDFSEMSVFRSSQLVEGLGAAESKAAGTYDAQVEALEKWDEKIKEVEADQQRLLNMSQDPKYSQDLRDKFKDDAGKIEQDLARITASRQNLQTSLRESNEKSFDKQIEGLENKIHPGNKLQQQSKAYQEKISDIRTSLTQKHDSGLISDAAFQSDMDRLDKLEKQSSTSALAMRQAFTGVGQSVTRSITNLANRYGRQLFMKAINEAKKFVQEFNKSMTSIQMITLKTDSQMSTLGDGLIAKAKELKISISEITQSAETLYRQGLSDQEVDERLEVISKFSKVSGTKVDAATKLITIAMNTGLVSDPQVAADVVTALGDSAATNASEIEKGIEKAGAAASADGTTFGQLAAMLTAITSTTQIGGNVAGRTLNTIFGRMNKIGTNELIVDENGNKVSGSAVAKLLKEQGIATYDSEGNKRSSYDVLYDLSQKWEGMEDAEQQQIAAAIAGTRMYSNFSSIMQGMAEGKVADYMKTLTNSEGTVDKKYEIYVKSLQASLTDLKNTYDELVKDLVNNGALTGTVNTITGMIQGVDNLTKSFGGLGAILATVVPLLIGIATLKVGMATGNMGAIVAGLGIAAVGGVVASQAGNTKTAEQQFTESYESYSNLKTSRNKDIDRLKSLRENTNRTDEENNEYAKLINKYAVRLGLVSDSAEDATYSVETLTLAIKNLSGEADTAADNVIDEADQREKEIWAQQVGANRAKTVEALEEGMETATKDRNKTPTIDNPFFNKTVWYYDENYNDGKGGYRLYDNALNALNSWISYGRGNDNLFGLGGFFSRLLGQDDISYDADIKDPLVTALMNAAQAGYMDEFLPDAANIDYGAWNARLINGMLTKEQLQAALNYINEPDDVHAPTTTYDDAKQVFETTLSTVLKDYYDADQIAYLADKGANKYVETGSMIDAYESIMGTNPSLAGVTSAINTALEGYVPKGEVAKNQYGLEPLGKYDYYVDEKGKPYSEQEANSYYEGLKAADKERAVSIMLKHNEAATKRNAEKEEEMRRLAEEDEASAEEEYARDLLTEAKRLYLFSDGSLLNGDASTVAEKYYRDAWIARGEDAASWDAMSENERQSQIYWMQSGGYDGITPITDVPTKELQRYVDESTSWDSLSEEERNAWIESAKANVTKREPTATTWTPEELIGGANATAESLGKLYDENGEILQDVADEIDKANKEANKGALTLVKKTHTFVESLDAYNTGDKSWLTKNQAAVSADNITSLLASGQFGEGAEGLLNFMNYIETNHEAELDWGNVIGNNTDLQRVMHQASYDRETGKWTGPEDIMTQMLHATQSGSLTYGAAALTTQQKANIAQRAFEGLTAETNPWFISQEAKDSAQEAAYNKYINEQAEARAAEEAAAYERYGETGFDIEHALAIIDKKYKRNTLSQEAFVATMPDLMADVMSPEQQPYLKDALGEQLYARVLEARAGGKALTPEEIALAQFQLNNRSTGLTSLTAKQQLDWLSQNKSNLTSVGKENGLSRAVADTYMSQWSGWNEYAALTEAKNAGNMDQFRELGGEKRLKELKTSLDNYQKNAEISLEVEGIKQLEEAGKVAEGTAAKIEKLRKGGKVRVEVEMQIHNEAYESGQKRARLYGGTKSEQDEEAMAILGMKASEYYGKNGKDRAANLARAQEIDQETKQGIDANSWMKLYNAEKTPEGQKIILDAAAKAGFSLVQIGTGASNNPFERPGEELSNFAATRKSAKSFVYTGAEQENVGSLVGVARTYTDTEKNAMLNRILNGEERTVGVGGNSDLYDAAIESAGEYTRELLRRRENGEEIDQWLQNASDAERREADLSRVGSLYATRNQEVLARQSLNGNIDNEDNLSTVASYLGLDQDRVKTMLKNGKKEDLSELLNKKASEAFDQAKHEIEEEFNVELDSEDWDSLIDELESATADGDEKVKARAKAWIDAMRDAATILTPEEAIEKYSSWGRTQKEASQITAIQTAVTNGTTNDHAMTWEELKGQIIGQGKTFETDKDFNTFLSNNTGMADILMRAQEAGSFTPEIMNSLMQISPQAVLNADMNYQEQYSKWNGLKNDQGGIDMLKLEELTGSDQAFREWLGQFENLQDALKDADGMTNGTSAAFTKLHNEMFNGLNKSLRPWGDKTEELVSSMAAAQKSASGMANAMKNFTSTANTVANNQYLREQWRAGKKNKDITEYVTGLGFDKKDVYNKDMKTTIATRFEIEEESDEEDVEEAIAALTGDFQEKLNNEIAANGPIEIDGVELQVGESRIVSSNDLLTAYRQYLDPQLITAMEYAKKLGFDLLWNFKMDDQGNVSAIPVVSRGTGSGLGSGRRSSSGKSGGKSATDKAIEKAGYNIKPSTHDVTMAQLEQEHREFIKDYQGQIDAIYAEAKAQKELAKAYEQNIEDLKAQQKKVKEYSEDWWKLQDAIYSAEEALKKTKNAIEALDQKEIAVLQAKQEDEDKPITHSRTMIDAYVSRYQTQYQSGGRMSEDKAYKTWLKTRVASMTELSTEIDQNKQQIAEWEALLATVEKGTKSYYDIRDKIWALQEENAKLENELLQGEIEINEARLARIAQKLQRRTSDSQHEIAMSETYAQGYQIDRDYSSYRSEILKQKNSYSSQRAYYKNAIEEARKQMDSLQKGSAAWYAARDAVHQYEEALAKLTLTQKELDQALRESYLNEAFEKLEDADTLNQQRLTAAQNRTQKAKLLGDDKGYIEGLENEEKALTQQAKSEKENLEMLMELKKSGKIKKGTKEWDELLTKIKSVENALGKTENDIIAKSNEIAAARLTKIMDDYKDNTRDTNHTLNMIKYQESAYKNSGELTNYGSALEADKKAQQELLKEQQRTKKKLQAELNRYDEGSDQYKNVLEQIQKIEEEIEKTKNGISSTAKAIKENEEAIRKVKINLENTLNNEMKKRVQEEKNQLAAEVSLQNNILDAIKKRYKDEWALIKKDLEKKKQALNEEKSMIQERMNARKEAESTEDKYTQLGELQKQLAIIEADPTRSKEAKELRKQISDLQKELSGNLADNIAQAEQKRLDDIVSGISEYEANREEDLNEFLEDNNNFKDILDSVLSGSEKTYIDFMKQNNENYKNATDEQKKVMEQGWHDTWLKMKGDVENYWKQVLQYTEITDENKDQIRKDFISYMKEGSEYQNASVTRRKSLTYEWGKLFDDYVASIKTDADAGSPTVTTAATSEDVQDIKNALSDNIFKVNVDDDVKNKLDLIAEKKLDIQSDSKLAQQMADIANALLGTKKYATGGLVDYTGLARVDGSPGRPEAFLSAADTANIRMMLDQLNHVQSMPMISSVPSGMFTTNNSIGDIHVTINEAQISNDYDVNQLARQVGAAFTKELTKTGFNAASYAF
jgi:TP901 family phage tail tape measure protein